MIAMIYLGSSGPGHVRVASGPDDFRRAETRRRMIVAQRFGAGLARVSFEVLDAPNEPEGQRIRAGGHNEVYGLATNGSPEWIAWDHLSRFPEDETECAAIGDPSESAQDKAHRIIRTVFGLQEEAFTSHEISTAVMLWASDAAIVNSTSEATAEKFQKALKNQFRRVIDRLWLPLPCLPRWDISTGAAISQYAIAKQIRALILRMFGVMLDAQTIADFGIGFEHHQIVLKVAPLLQCVRAMERREANQ